MSASVKPMAKSAREPLVKTAKTLDLTVSSREAHFKTAVNRKEIKSNSDEVRKITKKVTNQALLVGKRQYLENESEEIQLNFDVSHKLIIFYKLSFINWGAWTVERYKTEISERFLSTTKRKDWRKNTNRNSEEEEIVYQWNETQITHS